MYSFEKLSAEERAIFYSFWREYHALYKRGLAPFGFSIEQNKSIHLVAAISHYFNVELVSLDNEKTFKFYTESI